MRVDGSQRLVAEVLGGTHSTIGVVAMVEPVRAIFVADHMARPHEQVCGPFFGAGDLTADLRVEGFRGKLAFARSCIGAAAVSMGIAAIDVPYFKGDGGPRA
jgi:citrate lyase beta subunit